MSHGTSLRNERETLEILDNVLELIAYEDPQPRIMWANQAACDSVGVDEDTLGCLFEPLFTRKGVGEGIVYGIVNQHGGWIEVDSEVGKGSRFEVYLPVHKVPDGSFDSAQGRPFDSAQGRPRGRTEGAPSGAQARGISPGTETVLVAEDEAEVRQPFQRVLTQVGVPALFITRYGVDMVGLAAGTAAGVHMMEKPFAVVDLRNKVRELLDCGSRVADCGPFDTTRMSRSRRGSGREVHSSNSRLQTLD